MAARTRTHTAPPAAPKAAVVRTRPTPPAAGEGAPETTEETPPEEVAGDEVEQHEEAAPVGDGKVTVKLIQGEYFGLGGKAFLKGVPTRVTPDVAEILRGKVVRGTNIMGGRKQAFELPRFEISED